MTYKILSCDGGGIRGYMSCLMIQKLHQDSLVPDPSNPGKQIGMLDVVDGFAGTSTGGLISIALADARARNADMTATINNLVTIYDTKGPLIFTENVWKSIHVIAAALNAFIDALNAFLPTKYQIGHLDASDLPGVFAAQFATSGVKQVATGLVADRKLNSIPSSIVLAVNTVQLDAGAKTGWRPVTLSNHAFPGGVGQGMGEIALVDAALGTSAAPTYFDPHPIATSANDYGYFADGGTFANNPVMNGIEVAVSTKAAMLKDIEAISIGTGDQPLAITPKIAEDNYWGLMQWFGLGSGAPGAALLELALSASAENETRIAEALLGDRMARVNPEMPTSIGLATLGKTKEMAQIVSAYEGTACWTPASDMAQRWTGKKS